MTKDIDALVAAADALAEAMHKIEEIERTAWSIADCERGMAEIGVIAIRANAVYRAAREAVRKGTPPAYATSAYEDGIWTRQNTFSGSGKIWTPRPQR